MSSQMTSPVRVLQQRTLPSSLGTASTYISNGSSNSRSIVSKSSLGSLLSSTVVAHAHVQRPTRLVHHSYPSPGGFH
jgi:hypothetical protein